MKINGELKPDEIEIVWASGRVERFQTQGWAMSGATLMFNVNGNKIVVPGSSIRYFRANGAWTKVP